jgi:Fur family peroxide stress response transcriptional regulator
MPLKSASRRKAVALDERPLLRLDGNMNDPTVLMLREKGLRATLPRVLVWRTLAASDEHFTVEALWSRIREDVPELELSTVYRVIERFVQAGLVRATTLPDGVKVVEARQAFHPHVVCDGCGRVFHLPPDVARQLSDAVEKALAGFEVQALQVVGRGRCAHCIAAAEAEPV